MLLRKVKHGADWCGEAGRTLRSYTQFVNVLFIWKVTWRWGGTDNILWYCRGVACSTCQKSDSVWTWAELQSRDKVVWWTEDWLGIKKTMSPLRAPRDSWQAARRALLTGSRGKASNWQTALITFLLHCGLWRPTLTVTLLLRWMLCCGG